MTEKHECDLDRTFCTRCQTELEVGQVGLCGGCHPDHKIDLPDNGICPCGCKDLMLAKDQTEYTPVTRGSEWELEAAHTEDLDSGDPLGSQRLFCTACGQYFKIPEDLE